MTEQPLLGGSGAEYAHLSTLFQQVGEYASENSNYFNQKQKNGHTDYTTSFQTILNVLDPLQISLEVVTNCCGKFDISPTCKGNGYRSIISIVESCLIKILQLSMQIQKSRDKLFFRSYHVYMELESYTQVLSRLLTVVHLTIVLLDYSDVGCLFPHDNIVEDLLVDFEKISRECFYGRSFGFQYSESVRQSLQVVAVALAAYGDGYIRHNHSFARALSSMLHSGKYVVDPELRAKRITELTQNADIDFCRAFWSLTEEHGVQHAPLLMCPAMAVNSEFLIPTDPVSYTNADGKVVTVKFPDAYAQHRGVKVRLLSYAWREGQNFSEKEKSITSLGPKSSPKSRYLMLHCHGGGFVAQSSKSHEMYLRYWAKELKIPILSIDYSLAPDAPYPQALNEIYFAYVWALNNLHKLGTTGAKICFSGDSAGANLVTGLALKIAEANLRPPDCLVVAYPPYRVQFLPSPSRILCLMDPLLPLGVLKSCIEAYVGGVQKSKTIKRINSVSYGGEAYNAFDIDIGAEENWFPYNQYKLDHSHSFSESNLNTIKTRLFLKHQILEEDQESFYSEFPYSETSSSVMECDDLSLNGTNPEVSEDEFISFSAKKEYGDQPKATNVTEKLESSFLSSFTSQVSTKVQDLTSGVANYIYGKDSIITARDSLPVENGGISSAVKDIESSAKMAKSTTRSRSCNDVAQNNIGSVYGIKTRKNNDSALQPQIDFDAQSDNTTNKSNEISNRKDETSNNVEKKDENPLTKSSFFICKECLHSSASCCCCTTNKRKLDYHRKVYDHHYRSSHHHKNELHHTSRTRSRSYTDCVESCSQDTKLRRSQSLRVNRRFSKETELYEAKKTETLFSQKSREGLTLNLQSEKNSECDKNSPRLDSPKLDSPRIVYDKATESCVILTPREESKLNDDTPTVEAVDSMIKAFQDGKDPYLSPYLASDELLKKLPPITIVACSLDPLFDDSVEFVRKLHKLDQPAELYVLDKLPHGFLNFQVFSGEAREGCDLLIACIKKSLKMGMRREDSSTSFKPKSVS